LIDLEAHQPVDVLEGKQAEPLAQWLGDHPGVGILARDRSGAYAMAGRMGAPAALQWRTGSIWSITSEMP
jgi:hypothetical protein